MLKAYSLRLHRWVALLFAAPLLLVIVTGLILSFEPLAQQTTLEKPLTATDVLKWLDQHDPAGKATGLSIRTYEGTLTIAGVGPDGETEIDLTTGLPSVDEGFAWSEVFRASRGLHEHLLLNLDWLVIASTIAMLALVPLGLLLGWPRLRNTVAGWHSTAAWFTLPLVILSPLTGLAIAFGITFTPAPSGPRPAPMPIRLAVEKVAERHDLSRLTSLRPRGGRMTARILTDNGLTNVMVTPSGLVTPPRNWPRALHEGNWSLVVAPAANILISIVFIGLWFTGLFIWVRRTLKRRRRRAELDLQPVASRS